MGYEWIVPSIVVALIAGILQLYHAFYSINVDVINFPEYTIAYKTFIGTIDDAMNQPQKLENELKEYTNGMDFSSSISLTIHYNHGKPVEKASHRYVIAKAIPESIVSEQLNITLRKQRIHIGTINLGKCAYIHFPAETMFAISGGKMRSYPTLKEWTDEHPSEFSPKTNFVELMNFKPKMITFLAPLGNRTGLFTSFKQF